MSEPAAEALVNLSQNSDLAKQMVDVGIIKTAMDILYKKDCEITQLLVMLLVNLTQLDAGIDSLLQVIPLYFNLITVVYILAEKIVEHCVSLRHFLVLSGLEISKALYLVISGAYMNLRRSNSIYICFFLLAVLVSFFF